MFSSKVKKVVIGSVAVLGVVTGAVIIGQQVMEKRKPALEPKSGFDFAMRAAWAKMQGNDVGTPSKSAKKPSDPAERLFYEGDKCFSQGKFNEAIELYQKVVDNYPDSPIAPQALTTIGACYVYKDDIQKAIEVARKILEKYPDWEGANGSYFCLGYGYANLRDYENAAKNFKTAAEKYPGKNPKNNEARFYLGVCYFEIEEYDKAISVYQKIKEDYPEYSIVKSFGVDYEIGRCYESLWKLDEALDIYLQTVEKGDIKFIPLDGVTYHIAEIYEYKKDYEKARIWCQRVIDNYSDSELTDEAEEKLKALRAK